MVLKLWTVKAAAKPPPKLREVRAGPPPQHSHRQNTTTLDDQYAGNVEMSVTQDYPQRHDMDGWHERNSAIE
jgi:hypothetical protein